MYFKLINKTILVIGKKIWREFEGFKGLTCVTDDEEIPRTLKSICKKVKRTWRGG